MSVPTAQCISCIWKIECSNIAKNIILYEKELLVTFIATSNRQSGTGLVESVPRLLKALGSNPSTVETVMVVHTFNPVLRRTRDQSHHRQLHRELQSRGQPGSCENLSLKTSKRVTASVLYLFSEFILQGVDRVGSFEGVKKEDRFLWKLGSCVSSWAGIVRPAGVGWGRCSRALSWFPSLMAEAVCACRDTSASLLLCAVLVLQRPSQEAWNLYHVAPRNDPVGFYLSLPSLHFDSDTLFFHSALIRLSFITILFSRHECIRKSNT